MDHDKAPDKPSNADLTDVLNRADDVHRAFGLEAHAIKRVADIERVLKEKPYKQSEIAQPDRPLRELHLETEPKTESYTISEAKLLTRLIYDDLQQELVAALDAQNEISTKRKAYQKELGDLLYEIGDRYLRIHKDSSIVMMEASEKGIFGVQLPPEGKLPKRFKRALGAALIHEKLLDIVASRTRQHTELLTFDHALGVEHVLEFVADYTMRLGKVQSTGRAISDD